MHKTSYKFILIFEHFFCSVWLKPYTQSATHVNTVYTEIDAHYIGSYRYLRYRHDIGLRADLPNCD